MMQSQKANRLRYVSACFIPFPCRSESEALPSGAATPQPTHRAFAAEEAFGQIDILIATAGTMRSAKIAVATLEDYDYDFNFAVNTRGAFLTLSEAARRVRDGGRIIAFSTNLTRLPRAAMGLYQASKAAVEQMVFSLARELGDRGVTVNAIAPGGTDTSMLSDARRVEVAAATPLGRVATPGDIADVVAFLASDDSRWINGQVVGVNGGIV
jgi:3-oxoacyl-[acyl-carrier protein] reductase